MDFMKETDNLIEKMCLFELGHTGLENKIESSVKKIDKLFDQY